MSEENRGVAVALKLRFVNRSDTYAIQQKDNSYRRIDKPLTEDVILKHLDGKVTVGPYQLDLTNNHVKWACFDIDPERIPESKKIAEKICEQASRFFGDKAAILEASRFPDESYHIWILFDPAIPAKVAKLLAQKILEAAKLDEVDIEIFPKQEEVSEDGYGNLVKLPLGIHRQYGKRSQFLDKQTFKPLPNDYVLNLQGCSIPQNNIRKMLKHSDKVPIPSPPIQTPRYTKKIPECIQKLLEGTQEGDRNEFAIRLASFLLNYCEISAKQVWTRLNEWNDRNSPPLAKAELQSIMKSAAKGGYNYGCDDKILSRFCKDRENCFLVKRKKPVFDDKIMEIVSDGDLHDRICRHLSKMVKRDEVLKELITSVAFSAYSIDPLNLFQSGPSSSGKTYNAIEASKYFPEEDKWILAGLSPTALVHDYGNYDERKKAYVVDLESKILVFLEAPPIETYMKLRPILSHDKREIAYKFTDKTGKGKLQTRTVIVRGWPATIFCTSKAKYIEDLATRGFTVTPEMSQEKYKEVLKLKGKMKAFPFEFGEDEELSKLRDAIKLTKHYLKERHLSVVTPYGEALDEVFPHSLARDMRDFGRFTMLIDINALYSMFNRLILQILDKNNTLEKEFVIANGEDFERAKVLGNKIFETTRIGLPGNVLDFFKQVLVPAATPDGKTTYPELMEKRREVYGNAIGRSTLKVAYVEPLEQVGYIDVVPSTVDKRMKDIVVKETGNGLELFQKDFNDFFDEKKLKNWLNRTLEYFDHKNVHIITSLLNKEPIDLDFIGNSYFGQNKPEPKISENSPLNEKKPLEIVLDVIPKGNKAQKEVK